MKSRRPVSFFKNPPKTLHSNIFTLLICGLLVVAAVGAPIPFAGTTTATPDSTSTLNTPSGAFNDNTTEPTPLGAVQLLSGEVIAVTEVDGERSYEIDGSTPMHKISTARGTYIYPVGTDFNKFERDLFNVDRIIDEYGEPGEITSPPIIVTEALEQESDRGTPSSELFRETTETTPGLTVTTELESLNGVAGTLTGTESKQAYTHLSNSPSVGTVYYDAKVEIALNEADDVISAVEARQEYDVDGSGVKVAILDTGIDSDHPDLEGRVKYAESIVGGGTEDIHGHGTHVGGIVGGDGTASDGDYVGIAPNVTLYNIKVLSDGGRGSRAGVIDGIERADELGVDIMSLSLGGLPTTNNPYIPVINSATANGTLVVVSAGNNGPVPFSIGTPGDVESALTVAATDNTDTIAGFSSRGPTDFSEQLKPNIAAPGFGIISANGYGEDTPENLYTTKSGTSMSAPMVSGAAALLIEDKPGLPVQHVRSALVTTTDRVPEYDAYRVGTGRLNITRALETDVFFDKTTLNYGLLTDEETKTIDVTVTNNGNTAKTFDITAKTTSVEGADGDVSPEFDQVTIQPQSSETVGVTVNADTDPGYYAGYVTLTGAEETHRLNIGYRSEQGTVITVTKSGVENTTLNGDTIVLFNHDEQREEIRTITTDTDQQQFTFNVYEDRNYTVISGGMDESTNTPVLLGEPLGVVNTPRTVSLDERDSIPFEVNTAGLPDTDLTYLKTSAQIWYTLPDDPYARPGEYPEYQITQSFRDSSEVRVSPENIMLGYGGLAVPSDEYTENNPLDVDTLYVFGDYQEVNRYASQLTHTPANGITQENVIYHHFNNDDKLELRKSLRYSTDVITLEYDLGTWNIGDRQTQTIYRDSETNDHDVKLGTQITETGGAYANPYMNSRGGEPGAVTDVHFNLQPLIGQHQFLIRPTRDQFYASSYRLYTQGETRHVLVSENERIDLTSTVYEDGEQLITNSETFTNSNQPGISSNLYGFEFKQGSFYTHELTQEFTGTELSSEVHYEFGIENTNSEQKTAPKLEDITLNGINANGELPETTTVSLTATGTNGDCEECSIEAYIAPNTVDTTVGEAGWTPLTVTETQETDTYTATLDSSEIGTTTADIGVIINSGTDYAKYTVRDGFRTGTQSPPPADPLNIQLDTDYIPTITDQPNAQLYGTIENAEGEATLTLSSPLEEKTIQLQNGYFSESIALATGENTVTATVTDSTGATSTDTIEITYDSTAPTITSASLNPYVEVLPGAPMQATVTTTDTETTVESVTVDGNELTQQTDGTWVGPTPAATTNGIHSATVAVTDSAGNTEYETILYLVGTPVRE